MMALLHSNYWYVLALLLRELLGLYTSICHGILAHEPIYYEAINLPSAFIGHKINRGCTQN